MIPDWILLPLVLSIGRTAFTHHVYGAVSEEGLHYSWSILVWLYCSWHPGYSISGYCQNGRGSLMGWFAIYQTSLLWPRDWWVHACGHVCAYVCAPSKRPHNLIGFPLTLCFILHILWLENELLLVLITNCLFLTLYLEAWVGFFFSSKYRHGKWTV